MYTCPDKSWEFHRLVKCRSYEIFFFVSAKFCPIDIMHWARNIYPAFSHCETTHNASWSELSRALIVIWGHCYVRLHFPIWFMSILLSIISNGFLSHSHLNHHSIAYQYKSPFFCTKDLCSHIGVKSCRKLHLHCSRTTIVYWLISDR